MPLHDWTDLAGWEGVHHLWITELLRWIKPRLPAGYRAYIGSGPLLAVGSPLQRPDVSVRDWSEASNAEPPGPDLPSATEAGQDEPDEEVAVAALDPGAALLVERQGRLVAAVELISPRNKDRPVARSAYLARYAGYLLEAVHLVLIDVHRRPLAFSFADQIADALHLAQPPCPAPFAVSYRVGEPAATGGRMLAIWRRPLQAGAPCPGCRCRSRCSCPSPWISNRPTAGPPPTRTCPELANVIGQQRSRPPGSGYHGGGPLTVHRMPEDAED